MYYYYVLRKIVSTAFNRFLIDSLVLFQGFPYGLLWYAFLLVAFQVHGFSVYFAYKLVGNWRVKAATTTTVPVKKAN